MKLEDIRKLCDEATPGKWAAIEDRIFGGIVTNPRPSTESWKHIDYDECICGGDHYEGYLDPNSPDARFIAAARTLMPILLEVAEVANEARQISDGLVQYMLEEALKKLEKV